MDINEKIKKELNNCLEKLGVEEKPNFVVEIPKDNSKGDYATNVAMQLTKVLKKNPRMIAEDIINNFDKESTDVERIEIAGPGFINFFVSQSSFKSIIEKVISMGDDYGKQNYGEHKKYDVEFVSANPTGDLHLGHAWQAALGDSICNLLSCVGYDVTREYYVNDAGVQIEKLSKSIFARYQQALGMDVEFPADGYHGPDIIKFANKLKEENGDKLLDKPLTYFRSIGIQHELDKIITDLDYYRVHFDVFSHEVDLYEKGMVAEVIPFLKEKGYIYESEDAIWFRTTDFEDDKDRVVKKSDGTFTYFLPDIAYHKYKLSRGFDFLVDILGADHHGYIKRMEAAIQAMGYRKDQIEIIIHQMVKLIKDGEELKLSKRTGKAYTLRDLCDEIGVDATRYQFASKNPGSHMVLDIDLAIKKSNENPVYYIQYAHARCHSIEVAYYGSYFCLKGEFKSEKTKRKEVRYIQFYKDGRPVVGKESYDNNVLFANERDAIDFLANMKRETSYKHLDSIQPSQFFPKRYNLKSISTVYGYCIGEVATTQNHLSYNEILNDDLSGDLLTSRKEVDLLKAINEYEKVLLDAALNKAPYKLTNYLYNLASLFHTFYNECKIIDKDNPKLTAQRVILAKMTRITIKNGLQLIGVKAKNKM